MFNISVFNGKEEVYVSLVLSDEHSMLTSGEHCHWFVLQAAAV